MMELVRTKEKYLMPKNERDMPLFKHCADGDSKVTEKQFENTVKYLLFSHGVNSISIERAKE